MLVVILKNIYVYQLKEAPVAVGTNESVGQWFLLHFALHNNFNCINLFLTMVMLVFMLPEIMYCSPDFKNRPVSRVKNLPVSANIKVMFLHLYHDMLKIYNTAYIQILGVSFLLYSKYSQ